MDCRVHSFQNVVTHQVDVQHQKNAVVPYYCYKEASMAAVAAAAPVVWPSNKMEIALFWIGFTDQAEVALLVAQLGNELTNFLDLNVQLNGLHLVCIYFCMTCIALC